MRILAAMLFCISTTASASDLLGPIWHLQGKHIGDAEPLEWTIEYLDEWGRTIVDETGGHFYHDRCCGGYRTDDPYWSYSSDFYGQYPMYYIGTTMRYRITLTNTSERSYVNLRVIAIQEYLTEDDTWGEWIGPDAAKDWYVPELRAHETITLEGSMWIPYGGRAGLDQTHLQVQHWDAGGGMTGPGAVIIDDTKAAVWCPPELQDLAQTEAGAGAALAGTVTLIGGESGYVEAGQPLTVRVWVPAGGDVTVRVYDRRGVLLFEQSRYLAEGMTDVFIWNGTDSSGEAVNPGVYAVVVDGPGIQVKEKVAVVR